jgi:hypothetical protein
VAGTLALGEDGPGAFTTLFSGAPATRVAFTARVALPDSFADGARVWPRVGGTSTLRADFAQAWHAPWCEARIEGRTIVLRGYAFRLEEDAPETGAEAGERWIPLPPDQMRFGFTVAGEVRRPPGVAPGGRPPLLPVHPNPARGPVRIEAPGAGTVTVFDAGGRRVWRGERASGAGPITWPGTDGAGRAAPPGLYLIRFAGPGGTRTARLVRLA